MKKKRFALGMATAIAITGAFLFRRLGHKKKK